MECIENFWTSLKTRFFTSTHWKNLYKHTPGYVWFLKLIEKSHSQIKAWTVFHCTYTWHNTLTIHVSKLVIVEFLLFIKSQFTEDAQNILYLNECTHQQMWLWTVAPFQTSRGGFECFDRLQRGVCCVSSFQVGTEYGRFLKCPHRQKSKECGQHIVGLYLWN
jgi:hypothetical protein